MRERNYQKPSSSSRSRSPQKLGNVLVDLMAQRGYAQIASDEECKEAWKVIVGSLDRFTRATEIKRGTLQVTVANSVVMQELTFRKPELLASIVEALPDQKIKDLRFRIGTV